MNEKDNKNTNRKLQLLVSVMDHQSGSDDRFGIYVNDLETCTHSRLDYHKFNLPDELIGRFNFWQNWYNTCVHERQSEIDWKAFVAYGLTLAIDLKLFLGDENYHVSFGKIRADDGEVEIILKNQADFPYCKMVTSYDELD